MTVVARALPLPPPRTALRPNAGPNATLIARRDVTDSLAIFYFTLDEPLTAYGPGQYVSVGVYDESDLVQRPYSIVAVNADGTNVELFVRRLVSGRLSNLLWTLPVGDRVAVGRPKGLFTLDDADTRPRLMIASGTGIAPLVAMLTAAARAGSKVPTVLIHGASFADELGYFDRLVGLARDALRLDYRPTVSRPGQTRNSGWEGRTGRVEVQLAAALDELEWLDRGRSIAYLCGNPEMINACSDLLLRARFAAADIRVESFHVPALRSPVSSDKQGGTRTT